MSSLKVSGTVTFRHSAKVTYRVSANAKVTITLRRDCTGKRGCASGPLTAWSENTTSTRTFTLARRTRGRTLSTGRYTLTVATSGGAKTVSFRVR